MQAQANIRAATIKNMKVQAHIRAAVVARLQLWDATAEIEKAVGEEFNDAQDELIHNLIEGLACAFGTVERAREGDYGRAEERLAEEFRRLLCRAQ
jgi:hypothetical protein